MADTEFVESIWKQIEQKAGRNSSIVFWGSNSVTEELIGRIIASKTCTVSGIVDCENVGSVLANFTVLEPESLTKLTFDIIVITINAQKEMILKELSQYNITNAQIIIAGTEHMDFKDELYQTILESCKNKPRAIGYNDMLVHLYQSLCYISKNKLVGNIAEFGVYKGGTAVFLARIAKHLGMQSRVYAFDTFAGFPEKRSVLDLYSNPKDEHHNYDDVREYCRPYDIKLVHGDIRDTYKCIGNMPLVLTLFDTDNYSPAKAALELCFKQTVNGGIIAFDHYFCNAEWIYTIGERMAASEFFADKNVLNLHGTGIFIKVTD